MGLSLGLSDTLVGLSRAEDLGGGAAATSAGVPEGAPAASMPGCSPEAACWSWALVVALTRADFLCVTAETPAGDPEGAPAAFMPLGNALELAVLAGAWSSFCRRAEDRDEAVCGLVGLLGGDEDLPLVGVGDSVLVGVEVFDIVGVGGVLRRRVSTGLNSSTSSWVMVCDGLRL